MDDKRIITLLARKAAGEINAKELAELDGLLASHPDAVYYEEFMRELWKGQQEEQGDTNEWYSKHKRRHQKELRFDEQPEPIAHHMPAARRWKRLVRKPVALGLLIMVMGGLGMWLLNQQEGYVEPNTIEIVAERGVRKQLTLPDGTTVWLNADSRIYYADNLSDGKTRSVRLEGEAYFDVAKDKNRPFIITTDKIAIKVLGTAFNVKAYPMDGKTETTLIRGSIELSVNERPNEKILMKPNEKVAITDNAAAETGKQTAAGIAPGITLTIGSLSKVKVIDEEYIEETSWINDKLVFRNETLAELIPKLERWYNVNISVKDPKILSYRYTSTITEENIDQLLEALQFIHLFNYKIEGHDVIIY